MKLFKNVYSVHRTFVCLMFVTLALGIVFFATNNLDFLIQAITYGKASFPNIMYWLSKFAAPILIPLVFLLPSTRFTERIRLAKYAFILYGLLQILTVSWIFWFLPQNGFDGIFSSDAVSLFQKNEAFPFVATYVYWNTYSWAGNIASILIGIYCIFIGFNIDDSKQKVCTLITLLPFLRILLPIIFTLLWHETFDLTFWITNNYTDILSLLLISFAMIIASKYDDTWVTLIWDQTLNRNENEE